MVTATGHCGAPYVDLQVASSGVEQTAPKRTISKKLWMKDGGNKEQKQTAAQSLLHSEYKLFVSCFQAKTCSTNLTGNQSPTFAILRMAI